MNYFEWANEYWEEAAKLQEKISALKKRLIKASKVDANGVLALKQRIAVLYSMYLDCVHTAKLLQSRGGCDYAEKIDA
ncbi:MULTISPECIES: hypothetical protein [unclassified Ruminococcus]|uniref:hypothetical protein n=1 Tax=unclassified Ruminococcus TaxID=2608920 RepID=UPI0021088EDA|nr:MULTISPECIES: hypothetical protein [unclassified Ruminococcus]MCQ4023179.1 hypothetical protein [Ruminococcus sp. zg-924]MCQ4115397.1 hypothetical protein [Ruminococcus sp. zg-921]